MLRLVAWTRCPRENHISYEFKHVGHQAGGRCGRAPSRSFEARPAWPPCPLSRCILLLPGRSLSFTCATPRLLAGAGPRTRLEPSETDPAASPADPCFAQMCREHFRSQSPARAPWFSLAAAVLGACILVPARFACS